MGALTEHVIFVPVEEKKLIGLKKYTVSEHEGIQLAASSILAEKQLVRPDLYIRPGKLSPLFEELI